MTSKSTPKRSGISPATLQRMRGRLEYLYGPRADECLQSVIRVLAKHECSSQPATRSERDVVLITYGDQICAPGHTPLAALRKFLTSAGFVELINTVHILPFFPYSSDDGFSVIDYRCVDPDLGDWDDVKELSQHVDLMFDLVLNHCSQHSAWFQKYLEGQEPYTKYFYEAEPEADVSQVTRPRSSPLLTAFETSRGVRHVWTTFSADQVDLNFAEPAVLAEFLDILLFYVRQGARIIRLDAIAYLWKEVGTTCIHLPQTHEVVKLMRDVLDAVAPHVLLLTETNVPHAENVSYFGNGDEANMVYQFSLPPLLLEGFISQDAATFHSWLAGLADPPPNTTFFNFTASHDGIGVRPLEGLISAERFNRLVDAARQRGSLIGTKRNPDGTDAPYELNVTYVDALGEPNGMDASLHARRFLSSQAVMLALPGVPGVYFHSLVGTRNDDAGAQQSGIPRRINRRRFQLDELRQTISDSGSLESQIFTGYQQLLRTRIEQPAFHPDGPCRLWEARDSALLAFERESCDGTQRIRCVTNLADTPRALTLESAGRDLLSQQDFPAGSTSILPYQTMWIELSRHSSRHSLTNHSSHA